MLTLKLSSWKVQLVLLIKTNTKKHSAQLHLGKKNRNIFGNIKTNLASKARTNIR